MKKTAADISRIVRAGLTVLIVAALLAGCSHVGPGTVVRDRFDYVSAISESWKRQTLLNLLKTRYLDAPVFLDVASVISQYSLEQEVGLGVSGEFYNKGEPSFISPEITAKGTYADRPTVTYSPLTGEKFARSLLKPIPTAAILLLVQSGYPIDQVLLVCTQGINGLNNRSNRIAPQPADPGFYEVLTLLRQIQKVNGMRMRSSFSEKRESVTIFFREPQSEAGVLKLKRVLHLLGLNPDARKFRVLYGFLPENDREIAILSRSLMQVMAEYASYIQVPDSDISEGRVSASARESAETGDRFKPLIRVSSGASKPDDAFVAVPYRKHWFWIGDRDVRSKRYFYFLMVMFSFNEGGAGGQTAPILTVPTN